MAPGALGTFETIHTGGTDAITAGVTYIPRITLVEGPSATLTRNPHKRKVFLVNNDGVKIIIPPQTTKGLKGKLADLPSAL